MDRRLQSLLRRVTQGDSEAIIPAARTAVLLGYSINEAREIVAEKWVSFYEQIDELARSRVNLATSLTGKNFPLLSFFETNQALLSDAEWRLFAVDCAEHVLPILESSRPDINLRRLIDRVRLYCIGEATKPGVEDTRRLIHDYTRSESSEIILVADSALATLYSAGWHAARYASQYAIAAALSSDRSEIFWQRARLIDYLTGLSALPWPT